MILIDSNIPMYLMGASHPHKDATRRILERLITAGERLVTDVEVFREILHRYCAIRRREAIQPALAVLEGMTDEVFAIDFEDIRAARDILGAASQLSARDALHAAIMRRHAIPRILSFDAGFDAVEGITRLAPST